MIIKIISHNEVFLANKQNLINNSKFFKSLFLFNTEETEINLTDFVDPLAVKLIIDLWSGINDSEKTYFEIYELEHAYDFLGVESYIEKNISEANNSGTENIKIIFCLDWRAETMKIENINFHNYQTKKQEEEYWGQQQKIKIIDARKIINLINKKLNRKLITDFTLEYKKRDFGAIICIEKISMNKNNYEKESLTEIIIPLDILILKEISVQDCCPEECAACRIFFKKWHWLIN